MPDAIPAVPAWRERRGTLHPPPRHEGARKKSARSRADPMTSVRLSSASDFITPSLACVKPVQIDTSKKNRVLRIEGTDGAAAKAGV